MSNNILLSKQLYLQMFLVMSHWSGSGFWTFSKLDSHWTPFRYSVVVLYFRDLAALVFQSWPLQILQQFVDVVYVWVGQLRALDLDLGNT